MAPPAPSAWEEVKVAGQRRVNGGDGLVLWGEGPQREPPVMARWGQRLGVYLFPQ